MKVVRKWRWLALLVAVGALGIVGNFLFREREPEYGGKSVSYWFKQYCRTSDSTSEADGKEYKNAYEAFCKIGTNALSFLAKEALSTLQDTKLRTNFYAFLDKLPDSWKMPRFISRDDLRRYAIDAIKAIGPSAEVILPFVKDALDSENTLRRYQALWILSNVRTNAALLAPYFGKALRMEALNCQFESRSLAISALKQLGTDACPALSDLVWMLNTTAITNDCFIHVSECLGNIGRAAVAALPRLSEGFLSETNSYKRSSLPRDLFLVDGQRNDALEFLIGLLKEPDDRAGWPTPLLSGGRFNTIEIRVSDPASHAADQLAAIGPNARAAIPALVEALNGTNVGLCQAAVHALNTIGAPADLYLPSLEKRLISSSSEVQFAICVIVLDIDPANVKVQSHLVDQLRTHSQYEVAAVALMVQKISSPTEELKAVVREEVKSNNPTVRRFAAWLLREI